MDNRRKIIGANVRRAREAAGLTQTDLASAIGVRERTVERIESGAGRLSLEAALGVAKACGCTLRDISSAGRKS